MYGITVILSLFASIVALVALAHRLAVPYPILLVIGGLIPGFIPGLPRLALRPDLVFLLFLPPLLYWDAVTTSWREFRANLRPIGFLAIGLVIVTTCGVAVAAHLAIAGLSWPSAFVLGAIVSPTDAVAATSIALRLGLPAKIVAVVEGESLVNDATALVVYGTAVAAVVRGTFSLPIAALHFVGASVGGVAIGLAVGWTFTQLQRHMEDPVLVTTVTILLPFAAYLPAYQLGASGVLAAVTAGLYIGRQVGPFPTANTRLVAQDLWVVLTFVLTGLSFILLGLQSHGILTGLAARSPWTLLWYAVVVSLTVILVRILWAFLATVLARLPTHLKGAPEPLPPWRQSAVIAWSGMRGPVSLATALALPLATNHGPFPQRDLLVYLAFCVIVATLVLQGLSLPGIIRLLGIAADGSAAQEEVQARLAAARAALDRLDALATDRRLPAEEVEDLRGHFAARVEHLQARADGTAVETPTYSDRDLQRELIDVERRTIIGMRNRNEISDTILRRIERDLDLEEVQLMHSAD